MKRLNLLFVLLFAASTVVFAQIEVWSNGNVGVGHSRTPQHRLDVGGDVSAINIRTENAIIRNNNWSPLTFHLNATLVGATGNGFNSNVSFGYRALPNGLQSMSAGNFNTAFGSASLLQNRGNNNTAFGRFALRTNTTGSNNTAIGYNADVGLPNLRNATAIGYRALATESDQIVLGNNTIRSIRGRVTMTTFSDGRAKRSVRTEVPGLAFINLLNPVVYTINLDAVDELMGIDRAENERAMLAELEMLAEASDFSEWPEQERVEAMAVLAEQQRVQAELLAQERAVREARQRQLQTGFIAQDVRSAAESIGFDFSGVDVDDMGVYGLRYAEFVVPLVRAVQELSQINDQLQSQLKEQNRRIAQLEAGIIGIPAPSPIQTMSAPAPVSNDDWTSFNETAGNRTATLFQNVPNPFRQETRVEFYLPQTVTTAFLIFYDLQGRQLHQITLTQRGAGVEIIQGSQFVPGIYLYALIADGQAVAVKQMIITE